MAAATKAQLRTRVRQRANMEKSKFVTDTEIDQYVTDEYRTLYDAIIATGIDYFMSAPATLTIASGETVALPADFYKLIGFDRDVGGGDFIELKPFMFNERNAKAPSASAAVGSYRLWYYPLLTVLASDSTQILAALEPWEEFIVLGAAAKCLAKEESDNSGLRSEQGGIAQRIAVLAQNRDMGTPDRIQDVTTEAYGDHYLRQFDYLRYRIIGSTLYVYSFAARY